MQNVFTSFKIINFFDFFNFNPFEVSCKEESIFVVGVAFIFAFSKYFFLFRKKNNKNTFLIKSESLNTFLHLFYQKMVLIDIFFLNDQID